MSPGRDVGGRRADGTGAAYGDLATAPVAAALFLAGVENEVLVLEATITILLSVTVIWVAPGVLPLLLAVAAGKLVVITCEADTGEGKHTRVRLRLKNS